VTVGTVREVRDIPRITRATDAAQVALAAYARLVRLLDQLDPPDWRTPTDCPGWDVEAMVGHLIGAAKASASLREELRQRHRARRHVGDFDGNDLDARNALQISEHAELTPAEKTAALRTIASAAVRGRMRVPRLLRGIRVPVAASGSTAAGMPTSLTVGEGMDLIYTRDVWLHTIDIAEATARPLTLDVALDGRIVEDVVADWAQRHGRPFELTLTGPAGGRFRHHTGGPELELDAVAFCQILSGRDTGDGLLATRVLF
jgi:uncharacterized protein (TIGR03083 family)